MVEHWPLGTEPRCCLQDSPAAAFGPGSAVAGDFVPPAEGGPDDISSNSPGSPRATSADSPSKPAGTPDRKRSSADDNRSGVGSDMRPGCKPVVEDGSGSAEKLAGSSGNGEASSSDSGGEWKGYILSGSARSNLNNAAKKSVPIVPAELLRRFRRVSRCQLRRFA